MTKTITSNRQPLSRTQVLTELPATRSFIPSNRTDRAQASFSSSNTLPTATAKIDAHIAEHKGFNTRVFEMEDAQEGNHAVGQEESAPLTTFLTSVITDKLETEQNDLTAEIAEETPNLSLTLLTPATEKGQPAQQSTVQQAPLATGPTTAAQAPIAASSPTQTAVSSSPASQPVKHSQEKGLFSKYLLVFQKISINPEKYRTLLHQLRVPKYDPIVKQLPFTVHDEKNLNLNDLIESIGVCKAVVKRLHQITVKELYEKVEQLGHSKDMPTYTKRETHFMTIAKVLSECQAAIHACEETADQHAVNISVAVKAGVKEYYVDKTYIKNPPKLRRHIEHHVEEDLQKDPLLMQTVLNQLGKGEQDLIQVLLKGLLDLAYYGDKVHSLRHQIERI